MSTYTDLKNRVKETITVGFRPEDRVTTQKVRFYNEENEYWGSFSGSLSGEINIDKGNLSSVNIYDSTLINPVLKTAEGTIIDLGSMGNQLEELSVYVHEDIKGFIDNNTSAIKQLSNAISAVPIDTADRLSSLDSKLSSLSSEFKQAMSDEISARISADTDLSIQFNSQLTALAQTVAIEDKKIHSELKDLSTLLDSEVSNRIEADEKLSSDLVKYANNSRHYELFAMDASTQMPIKAKEFAVNKLVGYDIPDAFIVDQYNKLVGSIENYDQTTGSCRFTAYSDADYKVPDGTGIKDLPYQAILGTNSYEFNDDGCIKQCANYIHQLIYSKSNDFKSNYFDIKLMKPNMRNVVYNNSVVGNIYGAGTESTVSSGFLSFNPNIFANDKNLSVFSDINDKPFSINTNEGLIEHNDASIQLESTKSRFYFETGIESWNLKLVQGNGFSDYNARIYQCYYNKPEDTVQSFAVSMVPEHNSALGQKDYFLSAETDFETIVHTYDDNSYDLLKYDSTEKVLSYTRQQKLYKKQVLITDNGKEIYLGLSSTVFNKQLDETENAKISFNELSNIAQDSIKSLVLNKEYDLVRSGNALTCDLIDSLNTSRVKIIIEDTGAVDITLSVSNNTTAVFSDDNDHVTHDPAEVYNDEPVKYYGNAELNIDTIDFGEDSPDHKYAFSGYFYICEAGENGNEYTNLKFDTEYHQTGRENYRVNDIVIEIPDKEDGSIESREFLFVIKPTASKTANKANIKFVTPQGTPIDFFAEHKSSFEIDCEKFTTFRLQEIAYGKFALLDWDQSIQEARLDSLDKAIIDLSSGLSTEIINLSSGLSTEIKNLSAGLSTEIKNLSAGLSTEISSLSVNVYTELNKHNEKLLTNRNDINFLLETDRESMVYKGTLLSVDDHEDNHISCYFENALGLHSDPAYMFKLGFTYRISAYQNISDYNGIKFELRSGDVITFNKDTRISSVCFSDFDIIHDDQVAINKLRDDVITYVNETSAALCSEVDVKFTLGSDFSKLSGDFEKLKDFTNRTISSDAENKPGLIKIQDQFDYASESNLRNYTMSMISGTIKLTRI